MMNRYEELLEDAAAEKIQVDENISFNSPLKGLYIDHNIALSDQLETTAEKACILAEELGHHHTSVGNILDQSDWNHRKQEQQARMWAYKRLVSLQNLVDAYCHGHKQFHEVAEYLEITEEMLRDAIRSYRSKYGTIAACGEYYISFEPYLMVGKII